ncbi:MAG: hypothetical protein U5J97_07660 [Trueperaceae bacterium]|nr:hypothetical protein [Trueperaceae bacterium]
MSGCPRRRTIVPALALLVACLVSVASVATAQASLRVDGRPLGEARTDLVAGTAYAPLDRLAAGLGARLAAPVGGDSAALTLGGHVVVIDVVEQGTSAAVSGAVRRDGVSYGDLAAIRGDDAVWGPVALIARALGAHVGFLPAESTVVVVTPRANVTASDLTVRDEVETLRVDLDAPVSWTRFDDPAAGRTELLLRRADAARARTFRGQRMERVDLFQGEGGVRIRIDAPDTVIDVIALADGDATDLRIRATPSPETSDTAVRAGEGPLVVLDPGQENAAPEVRASLLTLAEAVADGLREAGAEVALTRDGASPVTQERRMQVAAGADLFVAMRLADLPPGEVRLWVLGEASDIGALDMAIRRNAAAAVADAAPSDAGGDPTDALRREILLGLVPDTEVGRRAGRALASALFQIGGYRAGGVGEAPLAVLGAAAGRGVLIEIGPDDLASPEFPAALATALGSAAAGAR